MAATAAICCPWRERRTAWAGRPRKSGANRAPPVAGGYGLQLEGGGGLWTLITLEPAIHQWLTDQERPRAVAVAGVANPWGPWIRVSRLQP